MIIINHINKRKNHIIIFIIILLLILTFTIPSVKTQGISTTTIPQGTGDERIGEELPPPYNETVRETVNSTRDNDYPLDVTTYLMGIVLLSSGTANLFRGNKYKWLSIFIAGFYVTGIIILLFILKFQNVANPSSTLRFIYFILCTGIGFLSGMFFVCLWPTGRILVGAIGGFSLSMFSLSTKTDGLFTNQIARYFWIGTFTVTFAALAGLQNYYQYVAIISTVATGCYCLLLGTDIFVRAGVLASFKLFWGFTQPDDYRYIVDENVDVMLMSIGFIGGLIGMCIQFVEFDIRYEKEKEKKLNNNNDDDDDDDDDNNNNNDDNLSLSSIIKQKFIASQNSFRNYIK